MRETNTYHETFGTNDYLSIGILTPDFFIKDFTTLL